MTHGPACKKGRSARYKIKGSLSRHSTSKRLDYSYHSLLLLPITFSACARQAVTTTISPSPPLFPSPRRDHHYCSLPLILINHHHYLPRTEKKQKQKQISLIRPFPPHHPYHLFRGSCWSVRHHHHLPLWQLPALHLNAHHPDVVKGFILSPANVFLGRVLTAYLAFEGSLEFGSKKGCITLDFESWLRGMFCTSPT